MTSQSLNYNSFSWEVMMQLEKGETPTQPFHRGLCPIGYHVPSKSEWETLLNFVAEDAKVGTRTWENTHHLLFGPDYFARATFQECPGDSTKYKANIDGPPGDGCVPKDTISNPYGFSAKQVEGGPYIPFWTNEPKGQIFLVHNKWMLSLHRDEYQFTNDGEGAQLRCIKDDGELENQGMVASPWE